MIDRSANVQRQRVSHKVIGLLVIDQDDRHRVSWSSACYQLAVIVWKLSKIGY